MIAAACLMASAALCFTPTRVELIDLAGPVPERVRFEVSINGRPAEAAFQAAARRLFDWLDRDGDGVLDAEERKAWELEPVIRQEVVSFDGLGFAKAVRFAEAEHVDFGRFLSELQWAGLRPVMVRFRPAQADDAAASARLFRLIDRDGDGKLDRAECRQVRASLARVEFADDLITRHELRGRLPPDLVGIPGGFPPDLPRRPPFRAATAAPTAVVVTAPEAMLGRQAAAALARRPAGGYELFDPTRPPRHVLALAPRDYGTPFVPRWARGDLVVDRDPIHTLVGGVYESFERLPGEFRERRGDEAVPRAALAKGEPLLDAVFPLADHNGDGTLDAAEVGAFADLLREVCRCAVVVEVAEHGRDLFALLDEDGEVLTPRELANAEALLPTLLDGSGHLTPAGVPRHYTLTVYVGGLHLSPEYLRERPGPGDAPESVFYRLAWPYLDTPAARTAAPPPAWFTKMDANRDGDVSRREFLGPKALFDKLDANRDGLISADEARAAK